MRERFDSYLCVGGPNDGQRIALYGDALSVNVMRQNPVTLLPDPAGRYEVGILGNRGKLVWVEEPATPTPEATDA